MLKFKVGDKVRIRTDLKAYKGYGNYVALPSMLQYAGESFKIMGLNTQKDGYILEESPISFWPEETLEPVNEYPKVMLVSNNNIDWVKRVVFMEKCNRFIVWGNAETMEESEEEIDTCVWMYARELPKAKALTLQEAIDICEEKLGLEVRIIL